MQESGIAELEVTEGEERVRISRAVPGQTTMMAMPAPAPVHVAAPVAAAPAAPAAAPAEPKVEGHVVKSPMVGTFYRAPTQQELFLNNFQTKLLDASFNLGGSLQGYLRCIERGHIDINGSMTPKDIHQLSNLFGLKSKIPVRSPLSISEGHLSWTKAGDTSLKGDIAVKEGPQISLDVFRRADRLKVNRLQVNDGPSQVDMTFELQGKTLGVTFSGELSERTLDKIFEGYQFQDGWARGDIQVDIDLDQPMQSVAQGKIKAHDLTFPRQLKKPLEISEISLEAEKNRVSIALASFTWGGERFDLSGDVDFSKEKVKLDIDLSAGDTRFGSVARSI